MKSEKIIFRGRDFAEKFLMVVLLIFMSSTLSHIIAQTRPMERSYIRGGVIDTSSPKPKIDSLALDSLALDSLAMGDRVVADSLRQRDESILDARTTPIDSTQLAKKERIPFFADSMSLSQVCWRAAALPGFGQIYNKQYWKLPILYSTIAGGVALFINENSKYKPLKAEYNELISTSLYRTEELNEVQNEMIRSNTRRQLYIGAAVASYIYLLGDAAVNYATNEVSGVKRATTLSTICPGAGQIYNKSYWKLPFVVGGFASMIFVMDWNNRGYKRFSTAYKQVIAYEANPDAYPDGYPDEFAGRYDADYLQNLRDSYRRNRDYSIILLAGLYVLQIIDAHVDAHFKDFDISDELALDITPSVGYVYSPASNSNCTSYGFNIGLKF